MRLNSAHRLIVDKVSWTLIRNIAREGVIIEWPLNEQFQDARDVILTCLCLEKR